MAGYVPLPASPDDPLPLTSLDVIAIARELERRFSVQIGPREFRPENFGSLAQLEGFVERKRGSS